MIVFDYMGHMVSTESEEELHAFALKLGLKREFYQTPSVSKYTLKLSLFVADHHAHYDLTTKSSRFRAKMQGAIEITPLELCKKAWWHS